MTDAEAFYYTVVCLAGALVATLLVLVLVQRVALGWLERDLYPDADPYDWATDPHWLDEPVSEYEAAALWSEFERGDLP